MKEQKSEFPEQQLKEKALLESLASQGAKIENDPNRVAGAYLITFDFEGGNTHIRVSFRDSSGADLVITNITTLPEISQRQGHGSTNLQKLLEVATRHNLKNIRAVQVSKGNEKFWEKNGFVKDTQPNRSNDFIYQPEKT